MNVADLACLLLKNRKQQNVMRHYEASNGKESMKGLKRLHIFTAQWSTNTVFSFSPILNFPSPQPNIDLSVMMQKISDSII